jgi:hypothetical protein
VGTGAPASPGDCRLSQGTAGPAGRPAPGCPGPGPVPAPGGGMAGPAAASIVTCPAILLYTSVVLAPCRCQALAAMRLRSASALRRSAPGLLRSLPGRSRWSDSVSQAMPAMYAAYMASGSAESFSAATWTASSAPKKRAHARLMSLSSSALDSSTRAKSSSASRRRTGGRRPYPVDHPRRRGDRRPASRGQPRPGQEAPGRRPGPV